MKTCFVISPIGTDGSEIRGRADQVLKHVIAPAAQECGYSCVRADQIADPGLITSQVITRIFEDDLVIADLTGRNPNVFYELALRHVARKPLIQIIKSGEEPPFDVAAMRLIFVDHQNLDSAARARDEIVKQIRASEGSTRPVDSPVSIAFDLEALRRSDNPLEQNSAEMVVMLQEVKQMIHSLREEFKKANSGPSHV